MAKTSAGIHIGKDYIEAAVVSGSVNRPTLVDKARSKIEFSSEQTYAPREALEDKISAVIKSTISSLKIKPDKVYSVLPESSIMLRHFYMPLLPRSEQAQAIKFEARKYIPFKLDDVYSDFKVISASKDAKRMYSLFIAAQKRELDSHLKLFKDAGVGIDGIDIVPFALLRVLNLNIQYKKDEIMALLQFSLDEKIVSINLVESNYPIISRDIPITQHVEALTEKLISELRLSFDYYKRKGMHDKIKKLVICGKGSLTDLGRKLSEELSIGVEVIDNFKLMKDARFDSLGMVIATGAAINGLGRVKYGVNLLPGYAKTKKAGFAPERSLITTISASVLLVIAVLTLSLFRVAAAKSNLRAVLDKSKSLPVVAQGMSAATLNKLNSKTEESLRFAQSLLAKRIYVTEKLNRIASNLPRGVWIESLSINNPVASAIELNISGMVFAESAEAQIDKITEFLDALKKDEIFMDGFNYCELGNLQKQRDDIYELTSYSIGCGTRKR